MTMDDYANLKVAAKVLYEAADKLMTYSDGVDYDTEIGRCVGVEFDALASETFDLYEKVSRIVALGEVCRQSGPSTLYPPL